MINVKRYMLLNIKPVANINYLLFHSSHLMAPQIYVVTLSRGKTRNLGLTGLNYPTVVGSS